MSPVLTPLKLLRSSYVTAMWTTVAFAVLSGVAGVVAARALGPVERGLLATAMAWSSVAGSLSAYGMPSVATYFVSRGEGGRARAASTVMAVALAPGVLVAVAGALSCSFLLSGPAGVPLTIAFAAVLPNIVSGAALGAVLGLGEFRTWGLLRILLPAVTLVGVVAVTSAGWQTAVAITGVIAGATVAHLATLLLILRGRGLLARPSMTLVRPVVSYMWRSVVSGVGLLVSTQMDQLVLSVAASSRQLGIYAVSASFCAITVTISSSTGAVVMRRVAAEGPGALRDALVRGLGGTAIAASTMAIVVGVGAPAIVPRVFGSEYLDAVAPLRILMAASVPLALSRVVAEALRGLGHPLAPARSEAIGAVLTCALLLVLLGPYGIRGAAMASAISYFVVLCTMLLSMRRVADTAWSSEAPTGPALPDVHPPLNP